MRHAGPLYGPSVWLPVLPVGSVTTVAVRAPAVGSPPTALVVDQGYALVDAAEGLLWVSGYAGACPFPYRIDVDYALDPLVPVPADVELAVRRTVALWMAPTLPAGAATSSGVGMAVAAAAGVKSYQVGSELRVEFADTASSSSGTDAGAGLPGAVPAEAAAAFVPYGYPNRGFLGFA